MLDVLHLRLLQMMTRTLLQIIQIHSKVDKMKCHKALPDGDSIPFKTRNSPD